MNSMCNVYTIKYQQLLRGSDGNGMPFSDDGSHITAICNDHKTDPITQRVKVIMSVGVMIVHAQRYGFIHSFKNSLGFT